jgi:hypothetical protein
MVEYCWVYLASTFAIFVSNAFWSVFNWACVLVYDPSRNFTIPVEDKPLKMFYTDFLKILHRTTLLIENEDILPGFEFLSKAYSPNIIIDDILVKLANSSFYFPLEFEKGYWCSIGLKQQ